MNVHEKEVGLYLRHYIGTGQEVEVSEDWRFRQKDTVLTMRYVKGVRLPLIGAVYDMISRERNPLTVKLVARRYGSMNEIEKIHIVKNIIAMEPFELNDGNGFWFARNYLTMERFRVDLDPNAFNGFCYWREGTPFEQVTMPPNVHITRINDYLQSQGIWIYGDEFFDQGLIIEK